MCIRDRLQALPGDHRPLSLPLSVEDGHLQGAQGGASVAVCKGGHRPHQFVGHLHLQLAKAPLVRQGAAEQFGDLLFL